MRGREREGEFLWLVSLSLTFCVFQDVDNVVKNGNKLIVSDKRQGKSFIRLVLQAFSFTLPTPQQYT